MKEKDDDFRIDFQRKWKNRIGVDSVKGGEVLELLRRYRWNDDGFEWFYGRYKQAKEKTERKYRRKKLFSFSRLSFDEIERKSTYEALEKATDQLRERVEEGETYV